MRNDHDRRAERIDLLEQEHDLKRTLRVEVAGRLIGDDHRRIVDERAGNGHTLLLAAGQLVRQTAALVLQPDQLQHIGHALFDLLRRCADDAHGERDVLIDRLVLNEAEVLENNAERAAHIGDGRALDGLELIAVNQHRAGRRFELRRQQLDDGRLAGAGRTDQKHELAVINVHIDAVERVRAGLICFCDVYQIDHKSHQFLTQLLLNIEMSVPTALQSCSVPRKIRSYGCRGRPDTS